ncbi:EcsC family protein [Mycolicibacterium septicum]|uniref:EcsC family protein n=1 Tax=Mycolicibacterium septicum TaxID=98668 RepID=UPI001AF07A16|nr:EcsC family protein [Mycolicibacterium septicum]QRY53827.1 EcsC family protein [Mycolicibacterium septicum]
MGLSEYEQQQLEKVREHKQKNLRKSSRRLVPATVQAKGASLFGKLQEVPGVDKAKDAGAAVLAATAEGAGKAMTRTGQLTTSQARVIRAYEKRGHSVEHLDDIRKLDLRAIDKVASFSRLHYTYSLSAAAEGAAAGLAVSGGQAVVVAGGVAGAGAGAAPGLGTIATAMGVDAAALLTLCSRVVAHDALYYGYDPLDPAEEVFMMQIIGLGLATTAPAKAAAYQQLAVLARSLATNVAWRQLNQQTFVKVAQKFATQFGQKLTKKKLGQFVPVAGVGIGAALNWKVVDDISKAAYWAYRERFLIEKAGNDATDYIDVEIVDDGESAKASTESDAPIDVLDILQSEGIDLTHGAPTEER